MCRAIVENVLSGTKAGFKATRNLVFNQKAERSTMNRQKSRAIVENVLSGTKAGFNNLVFNQKAEKVKMERIIRSIVENGLSGTKAGFKSILNLVFNQKAERKKMENQKSKSTFSAILMSLTLGVAVFLAGPVAAQKKYVTDPTTGKVVSAPEYGGTITYVKSIFPANIDPYFVFEAGSFISGVNEKLCLTDWAIDRDVFAYRTTYTPEFTIRGHLAESWETPDPLTVIVHIRKGVHWHNKAPMNGRELTADDIKYNFERILGLGDFTEAGHGADLNPGYFNVESIEATDKYTVVFKMKSITLGALKEIVIGRHSYIMAPEVVEQYGDVTDWRNVVGTGPFELTDYVEGSSFTLTKNPDYWGFDEKYPENRLPYVDELRGLILKEKATVLALMRSGKADYIGFAGGSQLSSIDTAMSLQRTNPELNVWPYSFRAETALSFNVQKPPWNDVRVRHAIQMAIDIETINATYFKGWADTTPAGRLGINVIGYYTPFEEWPEEVKQYYRYDPAGAEALLDEAGYPRGADGIRFSTVYDHYEFADLDYYLIAMEYLRAIGLDIEVKLNDRTSFLAMAREHKQLGLIQWVHNEDSIAVIGQAWSKSIWNPANVNDPVYDAMYEAAHAATTVEEQMRLVAEADMYIIEKHWWIAGPRVPMFHATQPWIIGYNGEVDGGIDHHLHFARLWIDQDLKKEMGH